MSSEERIDLTQARKLEALGALTSGVAHDFNNLLTIVGGNLELVGERLPGDSQLKDYVERALDAIMQGATLTHQLLVFARKQDLRPEAIDLGDLLESMRELLSTTAGQAIKVRIAASGDRAIAEADAQQLKTAIINLIINARDAMPDGGVIDIVTSTKRVDAAEVDGDELLEPGDYATIKVSDSGLGMSNEVRDHALEPFFTTKGPLKGSGLGLSTVYGFVKQSGGGIHIDSEPGEGARVTLYLPKGEAEANTVDHVPLPRLDHLGGDETLLVVEDNNAIREAASQYLRDLGYDVLEAVDAETAISIFDCTKGIDLVFTDIVMPDNGGRRVVKHVRDECPDSIILCTSGNPQNLQQFEAEDLVVLRKPYRLRDVANAVREALNDRPDRSFVDCGRAGE